MNCLKAFILIHKNLPICCNTNIGNTTIKVLPLGETLEEAGQIFLDIYRSPNKTGNVNLPEIAISEAYIYFKSSEEADKKGDSNGY